MEAIKAGTRCECNEKEHALAIAGSIGIEWVEAVDGLQCKHDAVRLVTVRAEGMAHVELDATDPNNYGYKAVPMCAACAEYHEAKAGSR